MLLASLEGSGTLWGQLLLLLTTVAGFAYMWFRDERKRRWEQEDRERLAAVTLRQVEEVKERVEVKGEEVKGEAAKAYEVANSVNTKMDQTNQRFDRLLERALAERKLDQASQRTLGEIESLSSDTNVVAHEIHDRVSGEP